MKKLLVITYYWPPSGGSGVQRWLKFCKYLRDFGWEPIVYTPENPDVDLVDATLTEDVPDGMTVLRTPIFEPRRLLRRGRSGGKTGGDAGSKSGLDEIIFLNQDERTAKQNLLVWIRTNLFIPDARRFWIGPSVKYLSDLLSKNPVDAIASTGPPQSMHLIARELSRRHSIPWLADFRDPWTGIVYFDRLPLTRRAGRRHRRLEAEVLESADAVTTVSDILVRKLEDLGAPKVHAIPNGYDDEDIPQDETPPGVGCGIPDQPCGIPDRRPDPEGTLAGRR